MANCTPPGHPDCRISCPRGCIAVLVEPNGPCHTACTGTPIAIAPEAVFSIAITDMQADDVVTALAALLDEDTRRALGGRSERVFLSRAAIRKDDLLVALRQL